LQCSVSSTTEFNKITETPALPAKEPCWRAQSCAAPTIVGLFNRHTAEELLTHPVFNPSGPAAAIMYE